MKKRFFRAKYGGAGRILASGIGDYRKELVEKYGGTYIDSSKTDLEEYVKEWSNGNLTDVNEIATALEYIQTGKINADELITKEVTLHTLVADGFEYLIEHGPEQIKVLIRISGENSR